MSSANENTGDPAMRVDQPEGPDVYAATDLGEGLFAPGIGRLFGRPFTGLKVGDLMLAAGSNNPIAASIRAALDAGNEPNLARVYGFSYLGNYYKLAEPTVFLVFSQGVPVPSGFRAPDAPIGVVGVEFKDSAFTRNVLMWSFDQLDVTVRIDIKIGWMKDLLLTEMASDNNMTGGDPAKRADVMGRMGHLIGR